MMKSPLFWKVSTLLGCILLLLVPLFMVSNLISERESYRNDVEHSLRQSTSGPQKLVGPLIAIPVTEVFTNLRMRKRSNTKKATCTLSCRNLCSLREISAWSPEASVFMTGKSGTPISK